MQADASKVTNDEEIRVLFEIKENIERSIDVMTGIGGYDIGIEDRQALVDYMATQNYDLMNDYLANFGMKNQERF
jgi:hypothetical protein